MARCSLISSIVLAAACAVPQPAAAVLVDCERDVVVMVPDMAWQPPLPVDGSRVRKAKPGAEQEAIDRWYAQNRPHTPVLTRVPVACEDQTGLLKPRWRPGDVVNFPPYAAEQERVRTAGFDPRHYDGRPAGDVPAPGPTSILAGLLALWLWRCFSRRST